ncbi:hypothetical protein CFP75_22295 [Amycolatopsis alba DSM 44262]|uniref:DUF4013 domain-containing protein n=1 Tax=Amycolatopsis alba DSM 44262 TaxID=1125972 RepID=A0A229RNG1_AMYAL|nr:hypothetical protein CFP75_22295 [Amycolatopsis alba DSM 44262]
MLAAVAGLLVAAVFLGSGYWISHTEIADHSRLTPGSYVMIGLFYLAAAFVTVFFNAALISQADVALRGDDPRVAAGLAEAGRRWLPLLGWSVVTATVTLILREIEQRFGFIGLLVGRLAGAAWNLITYLVLPVMMIEDAGVRHGAKRSAELLKRTWGEQAAGRLGIGLVGVLLSLAGFAVFLGAGFLLGGTITIFVALGISLVWAFLVSILCTTLSGIYQTALYRYAADGVVPDEFGKVDFEGAFAGR